MEYSPAWTQTGSAWTRFAAGISGDMAATQPSSGATKVAINNLRGDTVAEATATGLVDVRRVDEFGVVTGGLPSSRRYGFHGSKQREALTSDGTSCDCRCHGEQKERELRNGGYRITQLLNFQLCPVQGVDVACRDGWVDVKIDFQVQRGTAMARWTMVIKRSPNEGNFRRTGVIWGGPAG